MGRTSRTKKERKHRTKKLKEIIGTDLLSWKEALIKGETSGLYSLTQEQAYFKTSADKTYMHIHEFERKLRDDIDPNFTVVYNAAISSAEHIIQGHSVYFYVEPYDGYIKVMNVGKNADPMLPAESKGKLVKFKNEEGNDDEEAILYRGWVATYEGCKLAYDAWEKEGISPAMCVNPKEIFLLKKAFQVVGFKNDFDKAKTNMDKIFEEQMKVILPVIEEEIELPTIKEEIVVGEIE